MADGVAPSTRVQPLVCQLVCQLTPIRMKIRDLVRKSGEPRRNRTYNPQINSPIEQSKYHD